MKTTLFNIILLILLVHPANGQEELSTQAFELDL